MDKLSQQQDKKKKQRGQKAPKAETAPPAGGTAPATGKKGKGKGGAGTVDSFELELIIEELQNEIKIKDMEFKEIRDELDTMKGEYGVIMKSFKKEKFQRQGLESNKQKYIMLKELMQNSSTIQDQTFFDSKKHASTSVNGSLKNQITEQMSLNHKQSLASKYAMIWLDKVRQKRALKEKLKFYNQ